MSASNTFNAIFYKRLHCNNDNSQDALHRIRDVNETRVSIFFLDPRKAISQLLRIETIDRPPVAPHLLLVDRLFASPQPWHAYQMQGRHETKDSGVSK